MMVWDPSRRVFLKGMSLAAVGVGLPPSPLLVRAALNAGPGSRVLVKVFLRGGADGLAICVPHGDGHYARLRGAIALPRPGQSGGVIDLDGHFGLHPNLAALKPLWDSGRLGFVHAVGHYGLTRSHFDAQDFMESGAPGERTTTTGWLDRAIVAVPGAELTQSVALASVLPRTLAGPEAGLVATDLGRFRLHAPGWSASAETILGALYSGNSALARLGRDALSVMNVLERTPALQAPPANGATYPDAVVGRALRQAAQIIKAPLGTRCIFVDVGGAFDTHSGQLAANATELQYLGDALGAFTQDLGSSMDDVVVMVATEFGRAAQVNGAAGTDHGSAHCTILVGNRVRGKRVHGRWPGLAPDALYEGRDLAVTTDFRDVFAEVATRQLGIDSAGLFPGYTPAGPLGLLL
jgi:uncharacterized protein (DUF1501 family)